MSHSVSTWMREWLLPSRTMRRRILPPAIGLVYIATIALGSALPASSELLALRIVGRGSAAWGLARIRVLADESGAVAPPLR